MSAFEKEPRPNLEGKGVTGRRLREDGSRSREAGNQVKGVS